MIKPTIEELTNNGEFNRYELAVAVAKCARIITSEYSKQREAAEKTINKESDKTVYSMVNTDLCDKKSVKLAIEDIYDGKFTIVKSKEAEEFFGLGADTDEEAQSDSDTTTEDDDATTADESEPDEDESAEATHLIETLEASEETEE